MEKVKLKLIKQVPLVLSVLVLIFFSFQIVLLLFPVAFQMWRNQFIHYRRYDPRKYGRTD